MYWRMFMDIKEELKFLGILKSDGITLNKFNPKKFENDNIDLIKKIRQFHEKFIEMPTIHWMIKNICSETPLLETPKCPNCKKHLEYKTNKNGFGKYCSYKCLHKHTRFLEKESGVRKDRIKVPSFDELNSILQKYTVHETAKQYNVSRDTIDRWIRIYEIQLPKRSHRYRNKHKFTKEFLENEFKIKTISQIATENKVTVQEIQKYVTELQMTIDYKEHDLTKLLPKFSLNYDESKEQIKKLPLNEYNIIQETSLAKKIHAFDLIHFMLNDVEQGYCVKCGNPTKPFRGKYQKYCSYSCATSTIANDPKIKKKKIETSLEKYGVEHVTQSKMFKEKFKAALSKYEFHPNCKPQYHSRILKYHKEGKRPKEIVELLNNEVSYDFVRAKIIEFTDLESIPRRNKSMLEKKIENLLIQDNIKFSSNKKILKREGFHPLEIDILIDNVGIECNGLYHHSDQFKEKNYHLTKTVLAKNQNIDLLHFWENEIDQKLDLVYSIIRNRIGLTKNKIYARKCIVKELTIQESKLFCNQNHIQGFSGAKIHYGLFHEDKLVSYMSFGNPRYNKNYEWELIRFCNLMDTNVIGGAGKLFKNFIKENNPENVISYQDIRLFNGNLYKNLGFEMIKTNPPNYFYGDKGGNIYRREQFQKKMLKEKLEFFDEKLSEKENMRLNGYMILEDCGTNVWVWKRGD